MKITGPSFKARTVGVVLSTSTVAVLAACGAFLTYDRLTYREAMLEKLSVHSESVVERATPAFTFNDPTHAAEILASLRAEPTVIHAEILDPSGALFASYDRASSAQLPHHPETPDQVQWLGDHLIYTTPMIHEGQPLGRLVLTSDLSALDERLQRFGLLLLVALAGSLTIATLMAARLQRTIVRPVTSLAKAATQVSSRRDYSVRVPRVHNDEVGCLTDAFNQMLAEIQVQQTELKRYSEHLHDLVEERTAELNQAKREAEAVALSLAVSERRFRSLSAGAPIGIFQLDASGRPVYANPHLLATFGLSAFSPGDTSWQTHLHPDDRETYLRDWRSAVRTQASVDRVTRLCVGGEERWIHVRAVPLLGGSEGYVGTAEDITVRRRVEAEKAQMVKEHLRLSREAGMAEIATSVLHNVGNVLNSVNVSAEMVAERLKDSKVPDVQGMARLLCEHREDLPAFFAADERARILPDYLEAVGEGLETDQATVLAEVQALLQNVDHIKKIVTMQQSYARVASVSEPVDPTELVEEALLLSGGSLERHGIQLERDLTPLPPMIVDKHKALQILINLINNAKHAVNESRPAVRRVTISTRRLDGDRLQFEVRDTGVGISAEHLAKIFRFGFTTRKDGHGFGLHSGANAAKQLGGALQVASEGLGRGATFTLILPRTPPSTLPEEGPERPSDGPNPMVPDPPEPRGPHAPL